MTGRFAELNQLLDEDDPLWYAFGLNRPSDPEAPGVPDNLVLTAGLPGAVHATWAPARRAGRYRVYKKEAGDEAFQPVLTTSESDATISALRAGGTVQIQVSAANDADESQPCAAVEIVVPSQMAAAKL